MNVVERVMSSIQDHLSCFLFPFLFPFLFLFPFPFLFLSLSLSLSLSSCFLVLLFLQLSSINFVCFRTIRMLSSLILISSLCISSCQADLSLSAGFVEDIAQPLGIATTSPRFSWLLQSSDRNVTQSSYHLLVASTADLAISGQADVCDSGVVTSHSSYLVSCKEVEYAIGASFFWSVQATSNIGETSNWLVPQRFSIGLPTRSDWLNSSQFVTMDKLSLEENPWFKSPIFEIAQPILNDIRSGAASAFLHVASFGVQRVSVNGNELEPDLLIPSISDAHKRLLAHTYDVGSVLTDGATNVIGVWTAAPGWSDIGLVPAAMMAELRVQKAGSADLQFTLSSDTKWLGSLSSSSHVGKRVWSNYGGEALNHSLDQPGWDTYQGSIKNWMPLTVYPATQNVTPEVLEPTGVIESFHASSVVACGDCPPESNMLGGTVPECLTRECQPEDALTLNCTDGGVIKNITFADFGTPKGTCGAFMSEPLCSTSAAAKAYVEKLCLNQPSCSIMPDRTLFGPDPCYATPKHLIVEANGCTPVSSVFKRKPVRSLASEDTASCYIVSFPKLFVGWVNVTNLPAEPGQQISLQYSGSINMTEEWGSVNNITIGSGSQGTSFANRFNYETFQFLTVSGLNKAPNKTDFVGLQLMNKMELKGNFMSSDDRLNQIYQGFVDTNKGLTINGMLVDCTNRERRGYGGDAQSHLDFVMAHYSSRPFFIKWLQDWKDIQQESGFVASTAPNDTGNLPCLAWGGITCVLPYQLYHRTGDLQMVKDTYSTARAYLNYWIIQLQPGKVLTTGGLGDWQSPHQLITDPDEVVLFVNSYFVYVLKIGAKLAEIAGASEDAVRWNKVAVDLGALVHETYFDSNSSRYQHDGGCVQGDQLAPLMAGLVPSDLVDGVMESLLDLIQVDKQNHLDTGLFNTFFLAEVLSTAGPAPALPLSGGLSSVNRFDDVIYQIVTAPTYPS